jgi:hypothetical protein
MTNILYMQANSMTLVKLWITTTGLVTIAGVLYSSTEVYENIKKQLGELVIIVSFCRPMFLLTSYVLRFSAPVCNTMQNATQWRFQSFTFRQAKKYVFMPRGPRYGPGGLDDDDDFCISKT